MVNPCVEDMFKLPQLYLKIINYRSQNGNFKKIDDIKNVPGIGDSKFENINITNLKFKVE